MPFARMLFARLDGLTAVYVPRALLGVARARAKAISTRALEGCLPCPHAHC